MFGREELGATDGIDEEPRAGIGELGKLERLAGEVDGKFVGFEILPVVLEITEGLALNAGCGLELDAGCGLVLDAG